MSEESPPRINKNPKNEQFKNISYTKTAADKLPRWMKASKDNYSNYQKFLNYSVMIDTAKLRAALRNNRKNRFMDTADTDVPYTAFKISLKTFYNEGGEPVDNFNTDEYYFKYYGKTLDITSDEVEFYRSYKSYEEKVLYDKEEDTFYFLQPYDYSMLKLIKMEES